MISKKLALFIIFIFCIFNSSYAQHQCGFDEKRQEQLQNPEFIELARKAEEKIKKFKQSSAFSKMDGNIITIPIVVHVLHLGEAVGNGTNISDAQIQSSIDNLNDYYRGQIPTSPIDFEIEFALAQRDPNCNATTGINRLDASGLAGYSDNGVNVNNSNGASYDDIKALSSWPQTDYFNVWIVSELDGNNGGFGFQGYAYFYNETFNGHGSVMMSTVFGYDPGNTNGWGLNSNGDNSTVVHEVGHFFHLYHTFQGDGNGSDCPLDVTVGVDSDGCADTVRHRRETSTCPVNNSCTGSPWVDNNTINNIMGYYYCSDRLTNDQRTRSRAAMEGTSIANSKGATPIDLSYVAPNAVCSTNSPAANNFAGISSVELNGVTFSSSTTGIDGGNIDQSGSCSNYFEIDTSMPNALNIGVVGNFHQLGVWIDWNDDGDFNDAAEYQGFLQDIADNSVVSFNITYPSLIPYDDYVRVRIIEDLDDRYGPGLINDSPCYASLVYGQSEDYAIYVEPQGSITYTYNNTWSPSSPIGTSDIGDTIIIESGTANFSANTDCNTLTVAPGAALTINTGVALNATSVDLNSTSQLFSSLISDGTINGTVNYNRYTAQVGSVGTNDLISAPVVGQTFGSFDTANTNLAASGALRAFAPYNTSVGAYQNYDVGVNAATIINAGTGYRVGTIDGSTLTFTGTARVNDVMDIPISDASAGSAWNLIGNPYPSYIDFETFFNVNSDEFATGTAFQAIYGYDGNASNGWTVWNMTTILDTNITELIAPGQAFFVKSRTGGGLVDFTTAMRRTGSSDDFILGRQPIVNLALCKLNLNTAIKNSSTKIYFIEGTTRGLDVGYDAGSYTASTPDFSIFSNLVEDSTGLDMAIQALPYEDFNSVVIPIGIKAINGETLTISIDDLSSLPSDINVYLEDTVSNTWTLLNDGAYSFSPSVDLNGTGRFYIHYSSSVLSIEDNQIDDLQIYNTSKPKEIVIKGQLTNETTANLYDIRGRLVLSQKLESSSIYNTMDVSSLGTGIYLIKVFSDNQTKTQKLVIN